MIGENVGFFQLINHGIDRVMLYQALDEARRLFELPLETKRTMWQKGSNVRTCNLKCKPATCQLHAHSTKHQRVTSDSQRATWNARYRPMRRKMQKSASWLCIPTEQCGLRSGTRGATLSVAMYWCN